MAEARVFQEMQAADALRQQMREGVLHRFRESATGQAIGKAYDSDVARGAVGALRDAYRRVFEQGWQGKDVFDGRWHMDNNVGKASPSMEGMKDQYDQRASFYGWDNNRDNGVEASEMGEDAREQRFEMEQDNDIGM